MLQCVPLAEMPGCLVAIPGERHNAHPSGLLDDGPEVLAKAVMTAYSLEGFEQTVLDDDVVEKGIAKLDAEALRHGLRDGREAVRANSVTALGLRGDLDANVVVEIAVLLRDGSDRVRVAAARALGRLTSEPVSTVPRMLLVLRVAEDDFRTALIEAINQFDDIDGLLQDALDQPGDRILPSLAAVASAHDDRLRDLWLAVLQDTQRSYRSRANAAELLAQLNLTADDEVADAIEEFEQEGVEVKEQSKNMAAPTFEKRPPQVMEPDPIDVDGFYDTELEGKALKSAAKADPDKLRRAMHDGRDLARLNAARAIGEMGKSATPLVSELSVRVRDGNSKVGVAAAESLAKLKQAPELVIPALGRALTTHNPRLRNAILDAIDAYGKDGVNGFLKTFEQTPDETNSRLLKLVAARKPKDYVPAIAKLMNESDRTKVRERAAQVLSQLGEAAEQAQPDLLKALDEPTGVLRVRALDTLGKIGGKNKKVIARIKKLHTEDDRASVRYAVRLALERLGETHPEDE